MEAVSADKELENDLRKALEGVKDPKEQTAVLIESAKANGYELTEEELFPDGQSDALKELSEEELALVVGGKGDNKPKYSVGDKVSFTRQGDIAELIFEGTIQSINKTKDIIPGYYYGIEITYDPCYCYRSGVVIDIPESHILGPVQK